jgi:hypothetical protein
MSNVKPCHRFVRRILEKYLRNCRKSFEMLPNGNVEKKLSKFAARLEFLSFIDFSGSFHDQLYGIFMREIGPFLVFQGEFGKPFKRMCSETVSSPVTGFKICAKAE